MKEIPWGEIGAFGSFAIIIILIALGFVLKFKKAKNNPGTINTRSKCINDARFQTGLTNIEITKNSLAEMKGDMKTLRDKSIEQTNILNNIYDEAKDQTKHLGKICSKIGRK